MAQQRTMEAEVVPSDSGLTGSARADNGPERVRIRLALCIARFRFRRHYHFV